MNGTVSLDLRNIDIVEALKFLAVKAGANIIATKNVAGRVTLMVENVPVRDIFDIMLRSNGLAYAKQGDIYNVMTEEEYKAIFGRRFSDIREVRIFKLQYAIPEQAFSMLDALKSEIGRVLVEPDSGTALIMDTPERIAEIEKALATLEQKNLVRIFNLKYAKAKEVEEQLKTQLDAKKVGSVKADERSNQIIIQALPERMPDIENIITALDGKTREVLIDTQIIKVKLSDQLTQGIDWQGIAAAGKKAGMIYMGSTPFGIIQTATTAAATTLPSRYSFLSDAHDLKGIGAGIPSTGNAVTNIGGTAITAAEAMHLGVVGQKRDLDFLIRYLQTLGNTQVLSNPKLAVVNNQEARIHIGERQAYVTTTTTTGQTTTTVSEEVTFVDVGIQLAVTPTINADGYVTMKIKPEVSSVVSTLETPSKNKIPIIDTSMAETTVMVKDGSTIIIGGLRKEEKTKAYDQIPYMGNIPVIGFLFKSGSQKTEMTELLVMITPHIVSGDMLTTGNELDFKYKPAREYKDYKAFTEEADLTLSGKSPEDVIKPYREYSNPQPK
ncbi:MAG: secretin and TonB N-terminal domain-containing protein [Candidatus Omnitrophica bacterium]|nr:secretin and TonB N-terminal domain-containing protein [Candidatus Omnitrophota bacterium]